MFKWARYHHQQSYEASLYLDVLFFTNKTFASLYLSRKNDFLGYNSVLDIKTNQRVRMSCNRTCKICKEPYFSASGTTSTCPVCRTTPKATPKSKANTKASTKAEANTKAFRPSAKQGLSQTPKRCCKACRKEKICNVHGLCECCYHTAKICIVCKKIFQPSRSRNPDKCYRCFTHNLRIARVGQKN